MANLRSYKFEQEVSVGEYTIYLPDPPNLNKIANYKIAKSKQRFYPPEVPRDFYTWSSDDQSSFVKAEWDKRKHGYWFFNNGTIEYITGNHYFYIGWWKIPVTINGAKKLGLPSFIDSDRDCYILWDHCVNDPNSFGLIYICNRRDGKTYKGNSILYNDTSQTPEAHSGIQSKTNPDAKLVFNKLIKSWQKLPEFFKPIDVGESHPATSLRFYEPGKRDTKSQLKEYKQVLRSEIDFENAKEEAYDGSGLFRYLMDEVGKTVDANVHERWLIVRECLTDGSTITGKAFLTTTVEEMEKKGGKYCKGIWDDSDVNDEFVKLTKRTKSGLYRYFKPSYHGLRGVDLDGLPFVDDYGYSDLDKARKYLERRRKALRGDSLLAEMRKYPFTIKEAFVGDGKDSVLDLEKIFQQMEFNDNKEKPELVPGNFAWNEGERDSYVVWRPDKNGRWLQAWLPILEDRNKQRHTGTHRAPIGGQIVAGCDPFDNKLTTAGRKSDAASYSLRKFNPLDPYNSNVFVTEYINRPETPEIFYEDMILQNVFMSSMMLVETNKIGLVNYFRERGYYGYLMHRPAATHTEYSKKHQKEVGIPLTGDEARQSVVEFLISYVYDNIGYSEEKDIMGNCPFPRLLKDWAVFEAQNKWTDFDASVASMLAIAATKQPVYQQQTLDVRNFYSKYSIKGNQSTLIK